MKKLFLFALVILMINIVSAQWTDSLNNGLVSYYKFDQSSGNAIDNYRGIYNFTNNNTATYKPVKINNGTQTVKLSSWYQTPSSNDLDFGTNDFTINFWANYSDSCAGNYCPLLGNAMSASGTASTGFMLMSSNSALKIFLGDGNIINTGIDYSNLGIFMVTITRSGTNITIYTNGTSKASFTTSQSLSPNARNRLWIARAENNEGGDAKGIALTADELSIWNRSLTFSEINNTLFNNGLGIQYATYNVSQALSNIANNSYLHSLSETSGIIRLNVSYVPNNATGVSCYYYTNYNATLNQVTCGSSNTINVRFGNQTIYTFVNDSSGNIYYNNSIISVIKRTLTNPISAFSSGSYILNISPISSQTINSASFNFNGTSYSPTIATDSGGNYILTNSISIGNVNGLTSLYWNVTIGSNTLENRIFNVTANGLTIDNCAVGKNVILNFSNYDQDSLLQLTSNNYYNVLVKVGTYDSASYIQFNANYSSMTYAPVCLVQNITTNYRLDYTVQWNKNSSYAIQFYNIQNATLNNQSLYQNISLYNILNANQQIFKINVRDVNYLPLTGAVVRIDRQYIQNGNYLVAESPLTDLLGSTVAHLVLNNQNYNIYIMRDGVILGTFTNQLPYCNTLVGDCIINYNLQTSSSSFISRNNLVTSANYDDENRVYTVSFYTIDGASKSLTLNATTTNNGIESLVCSASTIASSGTLTCDMPTTTNGSVIVGIYDSGSKAYIDYVNVGYSKSGILPSTRYFIAGLLIPMMAIMVIASPSITLVMFGLGILLSSTLMIVDTKGIIGVGSFSIFIIVGIIILIAKISSRGGRDG